MTTTNSDTSSSKEADRFEDLARRIVAVPKKELDRRLEEERKAKAKDAKAEKRE